MNKKKAGWIGIRSALVGSFLFAILDGTTFFIKNTITGNEVADTFWLVVFVFCISAILSVIPGYLGGKIIERLGEKSGWSRRASMVLGAVMGAVTVTLISLLDLYIVLSAHNLWSIHNNPAFPVYVIRLVEAVAIAGLMGSWSGFLIPGVNEPEPAEIRPARV